MSTTHSKRVAVLGAGSWGTALAIQLARNSHAVSLWGHRAQALNKIEEQRENRRYLPGVTLPTSLYIEPEIGHAIERAEVVVIAIPSHVFRPLLEQLKNLIRPDVILIWATKGVEQSRHLLLHQVIEEVLGSEQPKALLSGPTFAKEVANGLPTAVTIASDRSATAQTVANIFHSETFRCYTSSDLTAVEIGGATKNILAIAAGIADGLGFGANTRAALMTRGLHEQMQLGIALGGSAETFMGLSGLGDLVLTCTDDQSRNRRFGLAIGRGHSIEQAVGAIGQVVEGIGAAREVSAIAHSLGIEMPIIEQVALVLHHNKAPRQAVRDLLQRERKSEHTTYCSPCHPV